MVHIYTSKQPHNEPALLTEPEKSRLERIKSPKTRAEFIHSHTFLNRILLTELGISIKDLEFTYNHHSKPYISEHLFTTAPIFFSLSHSGSIAVVAVSHNIEVGIDVEDRTRRNIMSCMKLSHKFYTANEQLFLREEESCSISLERFFQIWTLKEAYLKAKGSGINVILSTLDFTINNGSITIRDAASKTPPEYAFYSKQLDKYTLSLAANTTTDLEIAIN